MYVGFFCMRLRRSQAFKSWKPFISTFINSWDMDAFNQNIDTGNAACYAIINLSRRLYKTRFKESVHLMLTLLLYYGICGDNSLLKFRALKAIKGQRSHSADMSKVHRKKYLCCSNTILVLYMNNKRFYCWNNTNVVLHHDKRCCVRTTQLLERNTSFCVEHTNMCYFNTTTVLYKCNTCVVFLTQVLCWLTKVLS